MMTCSELRLSGSCMNNKFFPGGPSQVTLPGHGGRALSSTVFQALNSRGFEPLNSQGSAAELGRQVHEISGLHFGLRMRQAIRPSVRSLLQRPFDECRPPASRLHAAHVSL